MKCPVGFSVMDLPGGMKYQPVFVRAIEVDGLKDLLDDPSSSILLIDCRPFLSYNSGHIQAAQNVYCPPIVRRRYGRLIPLEIILGCVESRRRLLEGQYGSVVVYDDSTYSENGLITEDSTVSSRATSSQNLLLVLRSLVGVLSEQFSSESLRYLNGGFEQFSKAWEHLVSAEVVSRPTVIALAPLLKDSISESTANSKSNHLYCGPNCNKQATTRNFGIRSEQHLIGNTVDTVKCHASNDRGDPAEILSWMFLGNSYHASQENSLKRLGIFALLNVAEMSATDDAVPSTLSDSFCHMNIPIADNATSDISCNFPQAIEFIENVRLSGGKVLVHCLAGISRSPTICIAYLMYHQNLSLDEAYDFIKQRRSLISPNLNFMRQLLEYERVLQPRRSSAETHAETCEPPQSTVTSVPLPKPVLSVSSSAELPQLTSSITKSSQTGDRKIIPSAAAVPIVPSRKRPRPESLSFSIPCSGKPLKSVPYTPCTKQAIFTFDFPSVTVMTSSPTVSHSPLCSPT